MIKRTASLLLALLIFTATALNVVAAPVCPRVYRPDMYASVAYFGGEKYIALDVIINAITEPTGLLSVGFYIDFDGDALEPLWQTDKELNGDGKMVGKYNPPQMITNWPTFEFTFGGQTHVIPAAEGLCKPYAKTGKGRLNVNLVVNIDYVTKGIKDDGAMAIRLYFKPTAGFKAGDVYNFSIDGQYDESIPQKVQVEGSNGATPIVQRVLGYGTKTSITLTYADCGSFDLSTAGMELGMTPDGAKDIIWAKEGITKAELSGAFATQKTIGTSGKNFTVSNGSKTMTVAVKGDVNADGTLSTTDYIYLRYILQGTTTPTTLQEKIADTNSDGKVSTSDLLSYKRVFGI